MCRSSNDHQPLIAPFIERTVHKATGLSGGLSCAGYDIHLEDLKAVVRPDRKPAFLMSYKTKSRLPHPKGTGLLWEIPPQTGVLGVTRERFVIPSNICMHYFNKSSLARQFIHAAATLAEPGWQGWLTLELYNSTDKPIVLHQGQPIGQVVFNLLDEPSQSPYTGKYQNQPCVPIQAVQEHG